MKIVIHAGCYKTGTKSIKNFLCNNRKKLLSNKICYPDTSVYHHMLLPDYSGSIAKSQQFLDNYIYEGLSVGCETLLLSCEGTQAVIPLLNFPSSIVVLQYIRHFPSHNESFLSQQMKCIFPYQLSGINFKRVCYYRKNGENNDGLLSHNSRGDQVFSLLDSCDKIKQKHDIKSFSYEKCSSIGLVNHFCSQIGVDSQIDVSKDNFSKNVSPPTALVFFMMHCKQLRLGNATFEKIVRALSAMNVREYNEKFIFVEPSQYAEWISKEIRVMEEISEMVDDPMWINKSIAWLEGKNVVPYKNLPPDIQYDIFCKLPKDLQDSLGKAGLKSWTNDGNYFELPNLPVDESQQNEKDYDFLQNWLKDQSNTKLNNYFYDRRMCNMTKRDRKFLLTLQNVTLLRATLDNFDVELYSVLCFKENIESAIEYFCNKDNAKPDFYMLSSISECDIAFYEDKFQVKIYDMTRLCLNFDKKFVVFAPKQILPWDEFGIINSIFAVNNLGIYNDFCIAGNLQQDYPFVKGYSMPSTSLFDNIKVMSEFYNLLSDNESKYMFVAFLKSRLFGDAGYLPISKYEHYFHPCLKIKEGSTIIDAGVGADLSPELKFSKQVGAKGRVISFEPIKAVCSMIENTIDKYDNITLENLGLYSLRTTANFKIEGDGSHILFGTSEGDEICELETLDNYVDDNQISVDMIKIDVEGAELDLLKGGYNTILKFKPALAVSIYHHPTDSFIDIIDYIMNLDVDYDFYIGHHSPVPWETVLYAVPK